MLAEFGALQIYKGQLAILERSHRRAGIGAGDPAHGRGRSSSISLAFDRLVRERGDAADSTRALMACGRISHLGAATALLGEKAAMACTVAVEEVIDAHYERQVASVPEQESGLKQQGSRRISRGRIGASRHGAGAWRERDSGLWTADIGDSRVLPNRHRAVGENLTIGFQDVADFAQQLNIRRRRRLRRAKSFRVSSTG